MSVLCPSATSSNFFIQEGVKEPAKAMSAKKVALYVYNKMMKEQLVIIPGWYNKLQRLVPNFVKMRIVANMKK